MPTNTKSAAFLVASIQRHARLCKARKHSNPEVAVVEECRAAQEWIVPKYLEEERKLQGCWFEYQYLTAFQRNELYTKTYIEVFKALWPSLGGMPEGFPEDATWSPVRAEFLRNSPEIMSALHRARQMADALGLPYNDAIRHVMQEGILVHGAYFLPRPNQMYCKTAINALSQDRDYLLQRDSRVLGPSSDPRFLACHYGGDPPQLAALEAIQKDVQDVPTASKFNVLGHYLINGFISESEARRRFSADFVDGALAARGPALFKENVGNGGQFQPSCIGYAFDETAPECDKCPAVAICRELSQKVAASQVEVTGSLHPRQQRERLAARHRKRRERFRKTPEYQARVAAAQRELAALIPGLKFRNEIPDEV